MADVLFPDIAENESAVYEPVASHFIKSLPFVENVSEPYDVYNIHRSEYMEFILNGNDVYTDIVSHVKNPAPFLENESIVFSPGVVFVVAPPRFDNTSAIYPASILPAKKTLTPPRIDNTSEFYAISGDITRTLPRLDNTSVVYDVIAKYERSFRMPFVESVSVIPKVIVKTFLPPYVPVAPDDIGRGTGTLPGSERQTTDINKVFRDLTLSFRPHPLTGDVTRVFDYASVNQSMKLIITTDFYERPYSSQDVAGSIRSRLFGLGGSETINDIREDLALAIRRNEPRVLIRDIAIREIQARNAIEISIEYKVKTFERSERFTYLIERA